MDWPRCERSNTTRKTTLGKSERMSFAKWNIVNLATQDIHVPSALIDLKYEVVEINGYKTSTRCNSCNNPLKHCWTTNRDRTKFRTDTDQSGNYELIEGLRLCDSTECRNEIPADLQYRVLNIDKVTLCNATTIVNSVKRPQFLKYSSQNP